MSFMAMPALGDISETLQDSDSFELFKVIGSWFGEGGNSNYKDTAEHYNEASSTDSLKNMRFCDETHFADDERFSDTVEENNLCKNKNFTKSKTSVYDESVPKDIEPSKTQIDMCFCHNTSSLNDERSSDNVTESNMCLCENYMISDDDNANDTIENTWDDDSNIFELIDEYYALYEQVVEEQRYLCNLVRNEEERVGSEDRKKENEASSQGLMDMDLTSIEKLEIELFGRQDSKKKAQKKRVHFASDSFEEMDIGEDGNEKESSNMGDEDTKESGQMPSANGVLEQSENETGEISKEKNEDEEEELTDDDKIEQMLEKIEQKRETIEEKYQTEFNREPDLKMRLKFLENQHSNYEEIMSDQFKILSEQNEENGKLCDQLKDALRELKCKQNKYEVSSCYWDLRPLHRSQKQMRTNEWQILQVRNLALKIECVSRNMNRLKKGIQEQIGEESETELENETGASVIIQHLQEVRNYAKSKREKLKVN